MYSGVLYTSNLDNNLFRKFWLSVQCEFFLFAFFHCFGILSLGCSCCYILLSLLSITISPSQLICISFANHFHFGDLQRACWISSKLRSTWLHLHFPETEWFPIIKLTQLQKEFVTKAKKILKKSTILTVHFVNFDCTLCQSDYKWASVYSSGTKCTVM